MSDTERLVASFVQFLGTQLRCDHLSADTKESLEGKSHTFYFI